jgi:raffinose/stachyose/melibiose transport system permease protein
MRDEKIQMIFKSSRIVSLTLFAALILIPSLIVVLGSFKTDSEVYNKPLSLPDVWSLDNYKRLLSDSDLDVSFRNSVVVTLLSVIFTLLFASLASFAIARMITVSGKVLATLFALGLAIPAQINLVPIYYIFRDLGLTNSFLGLVIINVTTTLPISIFILTAFFREISRDMYEASEVDGASPLRIYRSIALPLSRPAMGATAIFLFVINWNDLLWPLLLIQESEKKTLPLAMLAYRGEYFVSFSMLFTAVMVASLPMVIMYLMMQRSFIAGLTAGAVKG